MLTPLTPQEIGILDPSETRSPKLLRYACAKEVRDYIRREIAKTLDRPTVEAQGRRTALQNVLHFIKTGEEN